MKKLFLILMLMIPVGIFAQSHNIVKDLYGGIIFRDSVRFVADSTHYPIQDSVHIINLGLGYELQQFSLHHNDRAINSPLDSIKLTSGAILYSYRGVAEDTTWFDEVWLKDSSGTAVTRAIASGSGGKSYLILNPAVQLLKVELVNYRAALPTRVANYILMATKKAR